MTSDNNKVSFLTFNFMHTDKTDSSSLSLELKVRFLKLIGYALKISPKLENYSANNFVVKSYWLSMSFSALRKIWVHSHSISTNLALTLAFNEL